jgi:ribosome-associated translation inhibitor RaiA
MQTELRLHNANAEKLLLAYVDRRLAFALSHVGERIGRVTARISASGPTRGELTCRLIAHFHQFGEVAAEATDSDVYTAIDRCAGRLARRCQSKITRSRTDRASRVSIRFSKALLETA